MNEYEARQEAKRERLRAAAAKRRTESEARSAKGWEALQAIPFGQPILVGHHSEKGDRAYRGRAIRNIDKSVQLANDADALDTRADAIGTGGISSDDPEAVQKLDDKLAGLIDTHAHMVEANREARLQGQPKPHPTWQLSNSTANIRRIQQRMRQLEAAKHRPANEPIIGIGWKLIEDRDENRYRFIFDAIPDEEVRTLLKSRAFKWSPRLTSWVRKITGNARFSADQIVAVLPR